MTDELSLTGARVLLAFSGGIDSCYSVEKLRRKGSYVEGLILDMTGDREFLLQASRRAQELRLPYRVLDVREDFAGNVVSYFINGYLEGRTPAPCTVCNPLIKWKHLHETAVRDGFDHIATGHYFRVSKTGGIYYLRRAKDPAKDQSYYLWMLPQEILAMALAPMGDEIKREVVNKSQKSQRESMGVCFLKGRDYREFIKERAGEHPSCKPGIIADSDSNPIGTHEGTAFYTTGQKKGLGLPHGYSITAVNARENILVASAEEKLHADTIILSDHKLMPGYRSLPGELTTVIRGFGLNPQGACTVKEAHEKLAVYLSGPAWAPAAGQPAVLYKGEVVVGGGFIDSWF